VVDDHSKPDMATRRGRFTPRRATTEDVRFARRLLAGKNHQTPTRLRILNEYISFCRLNGVATHCGLALYASCQHRDGRSLGTIETYVTYVSTLLRQEFSPVQRYTFDVHRRAIAMAAADVEGGGASPLEDRDLSLLSEKCSEVLSARSSPETEAIAAALLLMAMTGMRCRDISRLRKAQVRDTGTETHIQVYVMKNRQKRSSRTVLRIPGGMPNSLSSWLQGFNALDRPWMTVTATLLNRFIKGLKIKCTSYALRKRFIASMRSKGLDPEGIARITGHTRSSTISAFYDQL
jgi:integrase